MGCDGGGGGGGEGGGGEEEKRREERRRIEEEGVRGVAYLVCILYFGSKGGEKEDRGSNTNLVCSGGLLPQHKMKVVERFHIEWVTSVVS